MTPPELLTPYVPRAYLLVIPPGAGEFLLAGARKKTTDKIVCSLSVTPPELLTPYVPRAYLLVIPPGAGEFLLVGARKKTTDKIVCSLSVTPEGFKPTTFRTGI